MLKKEVISAQICHPAVVTPAVYIFGCLSERYPEFDHLFQWGWVDMDELRSAIRVALIPYAAEDDGPSDMEKEFGYNTFFPPSGKEGPFFDWIILRGDGEVLVSQGDIVFCPLPNSRVYAVHRDKLERGDRLFVPARWAKNVLEFAKKGVVEINPVPNSTPMEFWMRKANDADARPRCSRAALDELAPPVLAAAA